MVVFVSEVNHDRHQATARRIERRGMDTENPIRPRRPWRSWILFQDGIYFWNGVAGSGMTTLPYTRGCSGT